MALRNAMNNSNGNIGRNVCGNKTERKTQKNTAPETTENKKIYIFTKYIERTHATLQFDDLNAQLWLGQ